MEKEYQYPFTAIVGQENMKLALILNVINPRLGGVLIQGEKGTAKSTAVRALANLTGTMRVVNLPVSATEDRVAGTLNMEDAMKEGKKRFEPGLLAEADGNILYVDEVNLLDDHIVDLLLDAAAMGINRVEREGISYVHSARFVLVGTMNPEEGQLRPQLLDRFGMMVSVAGERETRERVEVIARRLDYEQDPAAFTARWQQEEKKLADRIAAAKTVLSEVQYSEKILTAAAKIGIALETDGHRADICMVNTARTICAWENRKEVELYDLERAAELVLPHRMHRKPFEEAVFEPEQIKGILYGE